MAFSGYRVTMLFNRADQSGWSEVYWTSLADFASVVGATATLLTARRALLAGYNYVWGIRYTPYPGGRNSQLQITTNPQIPPTGTSGAGALLPLTGQEGVRLSLFNSSAPPRVENRIILGLPDNWVQWDVGNSRLVPLTAARAPLDNFVRGLTQVGPWGWPYRSTLVSATKKQLVATATIPQPGYFGLQWPAGTGFANPADGTLVVSGFRGVSSSMNGSYGTGQWSPTTNLGILVRKNIATEDTAAYGGVGGMVRTADFTFSPYLGAPTAAATLVRVRKIGNPFGRVRGRRLVRR